VPKKKKQKQKTKTKPSPVGLTTGDGIPGRTWLYDLDEEEKALDFKSFIHVLVSPPFDPCRVSELYRLPDLSNHGHQCHICLCLVFFLQFYFYFLKFLFILFYFISIQVLLSELVLEMGLLCWR
jgi:hypothetical protein